jgi:hypothetical protein
MLDAGAAVAAALGQQPAAVPNFQGMWWKSPEGSEDGWGINFAHQGDAIFASWFTYDASGNAWYLSMTAYQTGRNTFAGTINRTVGLPLDAVRFDTNQVQWIAVGWGTLSFSDDNDGTFEYSVNGVAQTKPIKRLAFGSLPVCTWGGLADAALATNYTDMWWAAPAGSESGWGINFTHQGNTIFVSWFTYDFAGNPLWLSATLTPSGPGLFTGTLIRSAGPPFSSVPFDPELVSRTPAGNASVTFANGNAATFSYSVTTDGRSATGTKALTRFVFRPPATTCR